MGFDPIRDSLRGFVPGARFERRAEFRTAYAAGDESGIPIRIEYRPRSFLRLTFEAEGEARQPLIPSLFPLSGGGSEESA